MSLFNKTDASSPEFQALAARWYGYLKKIEARYNEILQETDAPLKEVINNIQYDTITIHNIITALKNQTTEQLFKKVDEGWAKMRGEMEKLGVPYSVITEQMNKALAFKNWMWTDFKKFQIKTFADAARKILENVKAHIDANKLHRCTQCGAELPIKIYSFMAVNIKCESCGSVNTYQPDDRIRALEYYVINNLAEENALNERLRAITDVNAAIEYYRKYYGYFMDNIPEKKDYYKKDMDRKITDISMPGSFTADYFRQ
jgi:hypothetical protein